MSETVSISTGSSAEVGLEKGEHGHIPAPLGEASVVAVPALDVLATTGASVNNKQEDDEDDDDDDEDLFGGGDEDEDDDTKPSIVDPTLPAATPVSSDPDPTITIQSGGQMTPTPLSALPQPASAPETEPALSTIAQAPATTLSASAQLRPPPASTLLSSTSPVAAPAPSSSPASRAPTLSSLSSLPPRATSLTPAPPSQATPPKDVSTTSIPRKKSLDTTTSSLNSPVSSPKSTALSSSSSASLVAAGAAGVAPATGPYGLPIGVRVPDSVSPTLIQQGKLFNTLKSLPINLINDALTEYDDAVQVKGTSIRNHGAYLFGVVKRYVSVHERATAGEGSGILPMGEGLTPTVNMRLEQLVNTGFCTRDEMNDKVRSKIRMLSEKDALFALDELVSVQRASIRNFGSYFMGILNRYMRGDSTSKGRSSQHQQHQQRNHYGSSSLSAYTNPNRFDDRQRRDDGHHQRGRTGTGGTGDRFYRDNSNNKGVGGRDRSRDRMDDRFNNHRGPPNAVGGVPPNFDNRQHQHSWQQQQQPQQQRMTHSTNQPMQPPGAGYPPPGGGGVPIAGQPAMNQRSTINLASAPAPPGNVPSYPGALPPRPPPPPPPPPQQQQPFIQQQHSNPHNQHQQPNAFPAPPHQQQHQQQQAPGSQFAPQQQQMFPHHQQPGPAGMFPHQQQTTTPMLPGQPQQQSQQPPYGMGQQQPFVQQQQPLLNQQQQAFVGQQQMPHIQQQQAPHGQSASAYNQTRNGAAGGYLQQQQQQPPVDILGLADKAASAVQALANQNKLDPSRASPYAPYGPPHMVHGQQPSQQATSNLYMNQQQQNFRGRNNNTNTGKRSNLHELPVNVQYAIQNLQATGAIDGNLDEGIMRMVSELPEHLALTAIQKFSAIDKSTMRNRTAYLAGVLRRELEKIHKR